MSAICPQRTQSKNSGVPTGGSGLGTEVDPGSPTFLAGQDIEHIRLGMRESRKSRKVADRPVYGNGTYGNRLGISD
jgi:hypothetical protein